MISIIVSIIHNFHNNFTMFSGQSKLVRVEIGLEGRKSSHQF